MRFFAMWHYLVALTTPSPMRSEHNSKTLRVCARGARPKLTYLNSKSDSELFTVTFFRFYAGPAQGYLPHYMQVGTVATPCLGSSATLRTKEETKKLECAV